MKENLDENRSFLRIASPHSAFCHIHIRDGFNDDGRRQGLTTRLFFAVWREPIVLRYCTSESIESADNVPDGPTRPDYSYLSRLYGLQARNGTFPSWNRL